MYGEEYGHARPTSLTISSNTDHVIQHQKRRLENCRKCFSNTPSFSLPAPELEDELRTINLSDQWACPTCSAPNPLTQRLCQQCGHALANIDSCVLLAD
eukprot:sb/3478824/